MITLTFFSIALVIVLIGLLAFIIIKKRNQNKCKHENLEENALRWDGVNKKGIPIHGQTNKCLDCGESISKTVIIPAPLKSIHQDETKMDQINKDNLTQGDCEHINFEREGLWDGKSKEGKPIGGVTIKCLDCGKKVYMSWETFKSVRRNESR